MQEKRASTVSGWLMLVVLMVIQIGGIAGLVQAIRNEIGPGTVLAWLFGFLVVSVMWAGLFVVNPNEAKAVLLFGRYVGTARDAGFWWTNPLTLRKRVSLRVRNFETAKLKVNEQDGNPIEIAAVVVWRVVETAEAIFNVDNYDNFVHVQSEAALRNLATTYPYDAHVEGELALRRSAGEIADRLRHEIQERLSRAGIEVIEARISHLAYAPEIAGAMLRRQQASAVIAARAQIVAGAVGMVEMALAELASKKLVDLDPERKASMVSNLLVVLCSEHPTQPVVNTGTLYH